MSRARWQWLVIATVAVLGAAGGAYLAGRVAPDADGVGASLALAGFGAGALVGVLVSGWWRPPAASGARDASPRTATEFTARTDDEAQAKPATSGHSAALVEHAPPPPPPDSGEPGWYRDQDGVRRYWDGERWTEIVWRERRTRSGDR